MPQDLNNLSDTEKLALAIDYVNHGTALPEILIKFLKDNGIYNLVINPEGTSK